MARKPRPAPKQFSALDVVAAACAAFRINGNAVLNTVLPEQVSELNPVACVGNKQMMYACLVDGKELDITEADYAHAEEVIASINSKITIAMLTGKRAGDFDKSMYDAVNRGCTSRDFGLLAYAPKSWVQTKKYDETREQIAEVGITSKALGVVGDKVVLTVTVLTTRYLQDLGCYSVFGHDGHGNLVNFLTQHASLTTSQDITAKIRKLGNDPYHNNSFVNGLNFVKPAKKG